MVIKDEQWELIEPFVKLKKTKKGRPRIVDDRLVIEDIFYVMRTGCQWRELPSEFPHWKCVYSRFIVLNRSGIWDKIWSVLKKLESACKKRLLSLDSTMIKAHFDVCGAIGEKQSESEPQILQTCEQNDKIGKTKGGINTKVTVICDENLNPIELQIGN